MAFRLGHLMSVQMGKEENRLMVTEVIIMEKKEYFLLNHANVYN